VFEFEVLGAARGATPLLEPRPGATEHLALEPLFLRGFGFLFGGGGEAREVGGGQVDGLGEGECLPACG